MVDGSSVSLLRLGLRLKAHRSSQGPNKEAVQVPGNAEAREAAADVSRAACESWNLGSV